MFLHELLMWGHARYDMLSAGHLIMPYIKRSIFEAYVLPLCDLSSHLAENLFSCLTSTIWAQQLHLVPLFNIA